VGESRVAWEQYIKPLMFSHNMAVHKATLTTPFYAMFGYDPCMPLWPEGDMFPEDREVENERVDPMLMLCHACKVVCSTAPANNQQHREQYTDQANQNWPNPGPTYQPDQTVWCRIHEQTGKTPKLQPQWKVGVIIGPGNNSNSYKVRKVGHMCKQ
jgi:hypothetical protein